MTILYKTVKSLQRILISVLTVVMTFTFFGCASNAKEDLAAKCLKEFKSRLIDPASLEIRGEVVYLKYTETKTKTSEEIASHEYIFCAVGYKNAGGTTVADIILYCDGEYYGTMNEVDKVMANSSYGDSQFRHNCLNAAIQYNSYLASDLEGIKLEGTENEWKYTRDVEILSGKNVAKKASVEYVKMN